MVRKRKQRTSLSSSKLDLADTAQIERIMGLLALLLVKGEKQPDKIRALAAVGFQNMEIARLLGVTSNTVNVALHRIRKKKLPARAAGARNT